MSAERQTPWYAEIFLAIGGWIAGLLAAIAIFAMAAALVAGAGGDSFTIGAAISVFVGAGFVGLGLMVSASRDADFAHHFAIACIASGLTAATGGVWALLFELFEGSGPDAAVIGTSGAATAMLLALSGLAIASKARDAILTFLIALAVYGVAMAAFVILRADHALGRHTDHYFTTFATVAGLWLFATSSPGPLRRPAGAALMIGPMLAYALMENAGSVFGVINYHPNWMIGAVIFIAAALWLLWLLRDRYKPIALVATAIIFAAAIALLPSAGGVAILMILTAFAANHRGLAVVGVIAGIWFIGRFYYDLSMTLLEKSAVMAGIGALILGGALLFWRFSQPPAPTSGGARRSRHGAAALAGFAAMLLIAAGLVNSSVWRLESAFREANEIYLPLGPRDPRSIIQGDYMVLAYGAEIYPPDSAIWPLPRDGEVFLKLDENKVASFSRLPGAADSPEPDEIRIDYVKTADNRLRYVAESFFFQEGEARAFQPAAFAIVRVAPDGAARLVGLADANRVTLGPPATP